MRLKLKNLKRTESSLVSTVLDQFKIANAESEEI